MNPRQAILLSTYRLPTETTLYLGDEEVAAYLNGYTALWHPAALALSEGLPCIGSPYDHEEPAGDSLFAVPDNPSSGLADDWEGRARAAGAAVFTATANRDRTQQNLLAALAEAHPGDDRLRKLMALPAERVAPFFGLGYGCLVLEALFEAMSHENALAYEEIRQDLNAALDAIDDPDALRLHLQSAADRLLAAREVVYPVNVYVIDLSLLDEDRLDAPWPASWAAGQPANVLACASLIERLGQKHPERLAELREKVSADLVEVVGGPYLEREDPLLPPESQLWNLLRGQAVYQELLGKEVTVFGRKRFGFGAHLPLLLQTTGFTHALLVSFDESALPPHHATVISWPSADGKQVDAFTRTPQPADSPQTYFHLAHYLHQTIMQDQAATLALLHRGAPPAPWYADWLELTRLAPVLGRWVSLSSYFSEVVAGDYTSPASPDEFQGDYLLERTGALDHSERGRHAVPHPISAFARQVRERRRLDAAWTFAAILGALGGKVEDVEGQPFLSCLAGVEDRFESGAVGPAGSLSASEGQAGSLSYDPFDRAAEALARRLVARGQAGNRGWLVLNPCSFIRRVALELPGVAAAIPTGGPVKASQIDGDIARVVVEVPALGFAWLPRPAPGAPAAPASTARMRLADERTVRNEFFEAEIDLQTGGLRGFRDQRTRINRLGALLVYHPGSVMRARAVQVVSTGPALGEVGAEGDLVDDQGQVLATYRQRYRAWLGRPLLEWRIELEPVRPVEGYPWENFLAARLGWRDESLTLLRGTFGSATVTSHTRPETPDFLSLAAGRPNTVLFPGGLPFHQRNGARMLDVLLVCQGETQRVFDLGIGLDREQPAQTALGLTSPVAVVPCDQGPPHVGAAGWLFHLDAPNVLLTSLRPAPDGAHAVVARFLESTGHAGPAGFRCVRDPVRAFLQDVRGNLLADVNVEGDTVQVEIGGNDLVQVRIEFS
jgi:alpha-mannosidase